MSVPQFYKDEFFFLKLKTASVITTQQEHIVPYWKHAHIASLASPFTSEGGLCQQRTNDVTFLNMATLQPLLFYL